MGKPDVETEVVFQEIALRFDGVFDGRVPLILVHIMAVVLLSSQFVEL